MKEIFKKSNVIYVFRHGETDWNREGRLQGHLEISINKQGKLQSKSLALILKRLGIEVLLSSDLKRAQETSQIISDELNLNPIFNPGFREVFLGDGQGKLINEVDFYFGKNGIIMTPSMTHFDFQMGNQNKKQILGYIFP